MKAERAVAIMMVLVLAGLAWMLFGHPGRSSKEADVRPGSVEYVYSELTPNAAAHEGLTLADLHAGGASWAAQHKPHAPNECPSRVEQFRAGCAEWIDRSHDNSDQ